MLPLLHRPDGYAFSQEEGGAVTQAEVIRAYDTTQPKPPDAPLPAVPAK